MSLFRHHRSWERILVARVQGVVAHHAPGWPANREAAVVAIHEVTDDPHLLGHAWLWEPKYAVHTDPWRDVKNAMLTAAGADPQHPDRVMGC